MKRMVSSQQLVADEKLSDVAIPALRTAAASSPGARNFRKLQYSKVILRGEVGDNWRNWSMPRGALSPKWHHKENHEQFSRKNEVGPSGGTAQAGWQSV
ncbi:hypothetical protein E4U54_006578 [Claviceps lovelessii]|nr:hypothetical protein E4U54_006578 [Claviceps lovelessii]